MAVEIYLAKGLVRYKGRYLLLKKVRDIIPENAGKWECPGGKIGRGENPEKALLREIKEETGLACKIIKELPLLRRTTEKYKSTCHVYLLEASSDKVTLSPEHSAYEWLEAGEVKEKPLVLFADLLLGYLKEAETFLES